MVQTVASRASGAPQPYTVLRPIFVGGERQEVGAIVMLVPTVGAELASAAKVAPAPAATPPAAAAEPDAKPGRKAKAAA